ncbi:MAG: FAD-dependent oxidoreductase [Tatlockia sp.]|jgi:protoporphyrinogen oxidase
MTTQPQTAGSPRLAIIGAGPSGLACGLFLKEKVDILESNSHVGGHASSFTQDGFTFDYGPHILFSRDAQILDFIVKSLGQNVSRCRRNNKIAFKDKLLKYPFENDLNALSLDDNFDCIRHFLFNPYKQQFAAPANMKEWFLKTFGEGICRHYLFPYNEKVWNIPVEQLSMSMADRIPHPNPEDILKSSMGYSTEGYLHQLYYFYPKKGGYQAICEAFKTNLAVQYQCHIEKIQFKPGEIVLVNQNGTTRSYQQVVSTMPVHELIEKVDCPVPLEIRKAVEQLIVNPMIIVSFALSGVDANQYTAVYFPEAEFLVNRISYPCTFSSENGPPNHFSLQAEITCSADSEVWQQTDAEILAHTKEGLQKRKLLPDDDAILFARIERMDRSYVVYDVAYQENAAKVRDFFESIGIHLLGRFSYFEYINIDMAVDRAIKLAALLNNEEEKDAQLLKTTYLNKALTTLSGEKLHEFNQ